MGVLNDIRHSSLVRMCKEQFWRGLSALVLLSSLQIFMLNTYFKILTALCINK